MAILRADAARTRRRPGAAACVGWGVGGQALGGLSSFFFPVGARAADPLVSARVQAIQSLRTDQRRADGGGVYEMGKGRGR
ncbi:hypothetical protein DDF67_03865 [Caulobacter endophyticus]|uniref:Uncharacterized protein n=1 Tax=Caulobacter endophyticus TaxID=2172652 RepID=A0A2T9KBB4_9CAUL|nr:hypothetical protein DDF67_03865 [Caulobacter endophyticus]